jgi:hypothetical protein
MKKIVLSTLLVVLALGVFSGTASAQTTQPITQGPLHEYMEAALAEKLNLSLATIEAEFEAGKSLFQIALDNGIAQADLKAFMLDVRTKAVEAALADGAITQEQADWMLNGRGIGRGGMMRGFGSGVGSGVCNGTGVGGGMRMHGGGFWQQQARP